MILALVKYFLVLNQHVSINVYAGNVIHLIFVVKIFELNPRVNRSNYSVLRVRIDLLKVIKIPYTNI